MVSTKSYEIEFTDEILFAYTLVYTPLRLLRFLYIVFSRAHILDKTINLEA